MFPPKIQDIKDKENIANWNMSCAVCALSMCKRLCKKILSFLFVRAWANYIYHKDFHFRFGHLISFPVKQQLWCGCQGEKSSRKISASFFAGKEGR